MTLGWPCFQGHANNLHTMNLYQTKFIGHKLNISGMVTAQSCRRNMAEMTLTLRWPWSVTSVWKDGSRPTYTISFKSIHEKVKTWWQLKVIDKKWPKWPWPWGDLDLWPWQEGMWVGLPTHQVFSGSIARFKNSDYSMSKRFQKSLKSDLDPSMTLTSRLRQ